MPEPGPAGELLEAIDLAEFDEGGLGHVIQDEGGVIHASATLAQAAGRPTSYLLGMRSWTEILHPADRAKLARLGVGPARLDARILQGDGATLNVQLVVREVRTGSGRRLVVATFRKAGASEADPSLLQEFIHLGARFGASVEAKTIEDYVDRFASVGLGSLQLERRTPVRLVLVSASRSSAASCALTTGYLSAAASRISGRPTLAEETSCARRGDPACRFFLPLQ
jgi:predicted hydrocarbon binding protein